MDSFPQIVHHPPAAQENVQPPCGRSVVAGGSWVYLGECGPKEGLTCLQILVD